MARYEFDGDAARLYLTPDEISVLGSLVEQLSELVGDGMPEPVLGDEGDPFALWEADLGESPDEPEVPEDPALQRLFPNPYPHDPQAASDHRRFTASEGRRSRLADAAIVREALDTGQPPVVISSADVDPWLKTLNAVRLVIATRLGVDDEEAMEALALVPDDDPRAMGAYLLDFLAELQVVIIRLTSQA